MKLKLLTALTILILLLTACDSSNDSVPPPINEESESGEALGSTEAPIYTELGIPLAQKYPGGDLARCVWDMAIHEGGIFLGSGDYDKNRGPVEIWRYDIAGNVFTQSGTVPDEEVNRFSFIFDTLVAPGIDPKEEWDWGNFYAYEGGEWVKHRTLPGGVHCFDIVEYSGMIFAGLGVEDGAGYSPIVYAFDINDPFKPLSLYKDGAPRDTAGYEYIRVYDFFLVGEDLYALLYLYDSEGQLPHAYELYRYGYDEDAFFFEDDWKEMFARIKYKYIHIGEKVLFDGSLFFTTGYLYETSDMKTVTQLPFSASTLVCDLYVGDDTLYILTSAKDTESGKIKTTVYELKAGTRELCEVFSFLYDVPSMSMVVDGKNFYIGMGGRSSHEKNGMLLRVSLPT